MENKNNSGGIGGGFLLGLLLGILLTLLLTTKKGREILKDFMDKTIQKISDLEQAAEEYKEANSEEIKKEIMHIAEEVLPHANPFKHKEPAHEEVENEEIKTNEKSGKQEMEPVVKHKETKQEPKQEPKPSTEKEKKHFFRKSR